MRGSIVHKNINTLSIDNAMHPMKLMWTKSGLPLKLKHNIHVGFYHEVPQLLSTLGNELELGIL